MLPLIGVLPFGIHVVDELGDPAPCATLTTTDHQRFVTDQAGWVAFHEPGLMGDTVWFTFAGEGYTVAADALGYRGFTVVPVEGTQTDVVVTKTGTPPACTVGFGNRTAVTNGLTDDPFEIEVVDADTGRGVPLVKVQASSAEFWTDSAGRVAVREPALLDQTVDFTIPDLHGYRYTGPALRFSVTEGGRQTVEVQRVNIAERLYRVTGRGVYRDTVLLGEAAPTADPVINGRVMGQGLAMVVPTDGRDLWVWGETNRPDYPEGLKEMAGALATPLADVAAGVDLVYFVDPITGFARPMAPIAGLGLVRLGGPALVDDAGVPRTVAFFSTEDDEGTITSRGVAVLNQATATFEVDTVWATLQPEVGINLPLTRDGYAYLEEYMRFRATMAATREPLQQWELLSPLLADGSTDRWPDGDERWDWRPLLDGRSPGEIGGDTLIDFVTAAEIEPSTDSVAWSPWRHRWHRVFNESGGASSLLGEMWYAEADTPYGPWVYATKVASHTSYNSHTPYLHQELSTDGQRVLWEATYTSVLSTSEPTPRYEYNQMMYQVDLEDPRLILPIPVYRIDDRLGTLADLRSTDTEPVIEFLASDRPMTGTDAVYWDGPACDGGALRVGGTPPGFARFNISRTQVAGTVPLVHATSGSQEGMFVDTDIPAGWVGDINPSGYVWENLDKRHSLVMDWLPQIRVEAGADLCTTEVGPGTGILLPIELNGSPGTSGGTWTIALDGVIVATSSRADLSMDVGRHVVVATWTSDDGTPYRDERWVAVAAFETPGETGGDTGDTDLPVDTGETGGGTTTDGTDTDDGGDDDTGCGCSTRGPATGLTALPLGLLLLRRRRR